MDRRRPRGDLDLLVDEVEARDHLRDRVLDLDAGVHLDEVEGAVLVEELDGAGAGIVELAHGGRADGADAVAVDLVEGGGGALLPHLLVAALQRAVALAEVNRPALAVAEDLHLDVTRLAQVLLEVDGRVAERRLRLAARGGERVRQVGGAQGDLHAASAAARGGLHQDREADLMADAQALLVGGDRAGRARHAGDAERERGFLGLDLVAHDPDVLGLGADEADAVVLEDLGEARVLRQEAVAGMDRLRPGDLAGGEQRGNVEVGVARGRRTQADGFVGELDVHRVGVGGAVDRHRGDAELLGRAQDPQRDLAPVGDEDLLEHHATFVAPIGPPGLIR